MILKINKQKTHFITNLQEFVIHYNANDWMNSNIHLYDEFLSDDSSGLEEIIKDYFASQKGLYSIIKTARGYYVSCYVIPFYVITSRKVLHFNTFEKAKDVYCKLAEIRLKDCNMFINYPKEKLSFDIYQSIIEQENINLKLIKNLNK